MNGHVGHDNMSAASHATSSRPRILSRPNAELETKVNELRRQYSSSSFQPRSQQSSTDQISLDGLDSVMNDQSCNDDGNASAMTRATSQPNESNRDDAHPNLMDYFYNQIKLTES